MRAYRPADNDERVRPRGALIDCAIIAAVFAAAGLLVGPHPHTPVIDDWLYAASVQEFLSTGHLRVGAISSIYPVLQVLWGSLFCALLGFSFTVLRASTLCLAAVGCAALCLTLRELGRSRVTSLLAALTVGVSPTFLLLSASFMTDVPFVALSMVALYWFVSGIERDEPARWWIGAAFTTCAFLVRPLAIALPVAAAIGAWRAGRLTVRWIAPVVCSLVLLVALQWTLPAFVGGLDMVRTRTVNIQYVLMVTMREYANWSSHLVFEAAFPMAPLVIGALFSRRTLPRVALATALAGAVVWFTAGGIPFPLPDNQTWSLREMAARTLIPCESIARAPWTQWIVPFLPASGLVVVGALVAGAAEAGRDPHPSRGSGTILLAFAGLQFVIANVLWLYNDRYYIAFAPALAFLATGLTPIRARIAVPVIVIWAAVSISGARDLLTFNDTVASTVATLERSGVRPVDIDAGWVSDGWRLYAHPENLPAGADRAYDVPFVTNKTPAPYLVSNCRQPGYELLETVAVPGVTWQATDRLFVLRKSGEGESSRLQSR